MRRMLVHFAIERSESLILALYANKAGRNFRNGCLAGAGTFGRRTRTPLTCLRLRLRLRPRYAYRVIYMQVIELAVMYTDR